MSAPPSTDSAALQGTSFAGSLEAESPDVPLPQKASQGRFPLFEVYSDQNSHKSARRSDGPTEHVAQIFTAVEAVARWRGPATIPLRRAGVGSVPTTASGTGLSAGGSCRRRNRSPQRQESAVQKGLKQEAIHSKAETGRHDRPCPGRVEQHRPLTASAWRIRRPTSPGRLSPVTAASSAFPSGPRCCRTGTPRA